jgi:hypothetical protein
MNGAAQRLRTLRENLERIDADLAASTTRLRTAIGDLSQAHRAIQEIGSIRERVYEFIQDLRNAETLAGPAAWRLLAGYDETFAREYLEMLDPNILYIALSRANTDVLNVCRRLVRERKIDEGAIGED